MDLFNKFKTLPEPVKNIIVKYGNMDNDYNNCIAMQIELSEYNYTFDFGLDAIPYNLKKVKTNVKL